MTGELEALCTLFGVTTPHAYEDAAEFVVNRDVDAATVRAALEPLRALVPRLQTAYGQALSLQFLTGLKPEFTLGAADPDFTKLENAVDDDQAVLTFDLKVIKATLAAQLGLAEDGIATRLFLYPEALAAYLNEPLAALDQKLFAGVAEEQKLIIFVASHDIRLEGEFLAIIGGAHMKDRQKPAAAPVTPMLARAADAVSHSDFKLTRLTPRHLTVKVTNAADRDPVAAALHGQLFVCSLAYLAKRTKWTGAGWKFTFSSNRQEAEVELAAQAPAPSASQWTSARILAGVAKWVYDIERDVDDRLTVIQYTVVEALKNQSAATNGGEVLRLAAELEKRATWGWDAFIAGELKKFIEHVKALEDAVAATAKEYDEQLSALTKSLTDNMLAAVAFVAGSFIAAILKSPFDTVAFVAGTSVFALYLGLIAMGISLRAMRERFDNTKAQFAERQASYAKRLLPGPVAEIVRPVIARSEPAFEKWYCRTKWIYRSVLALLVIAMIAVPIAIHVLADDPDSFTLTTATRDLPLPGTVTIRGEGFDRKKDIIVHLGGGVFSTATDQPTLRVFGTSALIFTPAARDLPAKEAVVWQGRVGPKRVVVR